MTPAEIASILRKNASLWRLDSSQPQEEVQRLIASGKARQFASSTANSILSFLLEAKIVRKLSLPFPHRIEHRYVLGQVSNFAVIQSLDRKGYFSHLTALHLHDLTDEQPKFIYFNVEQQASGGDGELTQDAVDRAFKLNPRVTSNFIKFNRVQIYKLNGRNTHQLGVVEIKHESCEAALRTTDIERTLIDATVRPVYSGGVAVVARAFEIARDRTSVDTIATYLRKLNYVYPYHQAVGFYLARAGFADNELSALRQFPLEIDFYLAHRMGATEHNKRWRLFVPKGF